MIGLDDVLSRLDGVRRTSRGWSARCPAHEDRRASLSVRERDDGRGVLLHCFASCSYDEIVRNLKLEPVPRRDAGGDHSLDVHALALRIARAQPWAREDVSTIYFISREIGRRRRVVDIARDAATRAGDCESAWSLLARAARLDVQALATEHALDEALG